jgi:hypothetical protein
MVPLGWPAGPLGSREDVGPATYARYTASARFHPPSLANLLQSSRARFKIRIANCGAFAVGSSDLAMKMAPPFPQGGAKVFASLGLFLNASG